jgi:type I protein arginine methyltransferase
MLSRLQSWSVRACAAWRRVCVRGDAWIQRHPAWARWVYPPDDDDEARYRRFNERYFASWHEQERMLADQPRMDFYAALIERHVRPGDHVVDLGTGTGILAALAARRGASRVHAIDHSEILNHARLLVARNGITNVEFHAVHSRQFRLPEPVDVILHEQMGDALFDEDMVNNILDLRDRLLKPGGRVLPSRFEFYCEPVMINPRRHVPFIWRLKVHGFDYSSLEWDRPQDPAYYRLAAGDGAVVDHLLAPPKPVLTVDLETLQPADLPRELQYERLVSRPGSFDGLVVYFRVHGGDGLTLTTDPADPARAPHWGFRILRTETVEVAAGDRIRVGLTVERWADVDTWRWRCETFPRAGDRCLH